MGEVHHFPESFFEVFDVELGGDAGTYVGVNAGPLVNAGSLVNHLDARDLPGRQSRETHGFRRASSLQRFHRANEGFLCLGNLRSPLNRLAERFHEVVVLHEALLDSDKSLIRGLQLG